MKKTLQEHVNEIITNNTDEDYTRPAFLKDLSENGCASGMVPELIYYKDTEEFYARHRSEIDKLLADSLSDCGLSPTQLFGDNWDESDPLANEINNQNLLAWFAFETLAIDGIR